MLLVNMCRQCQGWLKYQSQLIENTSLFYIMFGVLRRYFCVKLYDAFTSEFTVKRKNSEQFLT